LLMWLARRQLTAQRAAANRASRTAAKLYITVARLDGCNVLLAGPTSFGS
jgi:hypothetical protein